MRPKTGTLIGRPKSTSPKAIPILLQIHTTGVRQLFASLRFKAQNPEIASLRSINPACLVIESLPMQLAAKDAYLSSPWSLRAGKMHEPSIRMDSRQNDDT